METNEDKIEEVLTPKQEAFCRFYTQNSELFGNGLLSYTRAYGYDLDHADRTREKDDNGKEIIGSSDYDRMNLNCRASASRLLTNDNIIKRVTTLLNEYLNNQNIDARLAEIILKGDHADSLRAISEYNKLKQRIIDKKDITTDGKPITINFDPIFNAAPRKTETDNS